MAITDVDEWLNELEISAPFDPDNCGDCEQYITLLSMVSGEENSNVFQCILESIYPGYEDDSVYEITYQTLWKFQPRIFAEQLAEHLGEHIVNMEGQEDTVGKLLAPLAQKSRKSYLTAFVNCLKQTLPDDKEFICRFFNEHQEYFGNRFILGKKNKPKDSQPDPEELHIWDNRGEIQRSDICICTECYSWFTPDKITNWYEDKHACCPNPECSMTGCVIGSASGLNLKNFDKKNHNVPKKKNKPEKPKTYPKFHIIRLVPDECRYYPKSVGPLALHTSKNHYVDHTQVHISKDTSRVGGPIVDLPNGMKYPNNMFFVAQLNLSQISQYDVDKLLPECGFLYFFIGKNGNRGKVFYCNENPDNLERVIVEHDLWFWQGCIINKVYAAEETFESRYCYDEYSDDEEKSLEWDYYAGSEISKIFGIFTHCQKSEAYIKRITESKIILLQIGEDFSVEGVLSIIIDKKDLRKLDFSNCKFEWGQS